jgi:hypothetical protein
LGVLHHHDAEQRNCFVSEVPMSAVNRYNAKDRLVVRLRDVNHKVYDLVDVQHHHFEDELLGNFVVES